MRLVTAILVTGLFAAMPSAARAAVFTPSPADLQDLDSTQTYAWRIDVSSIKTDNVTSATLVFSNLYSSNTSANELFIHLFNKMQTPSGGSWIDTDPSSTTNPIDVYKFTDSNTTTISDAYSTPPNWLVGGNLFVTQFSLPGPAQGPDTTTGTTNPGDQMTYVNGKWVYNDPTGSAPSGGSSTGTAASNGGTWTATYGKTVGTTQYYNYSYTFSAGELAFLNSYIDDGWIALGFDPDSHFYNDGISFNLTTTPNVPNPEPASLILLGTGIAGAGMRAYRNRKKVRAAP